jgi:hypothetical protein
MRKGMKKCEVSMDYQTAEFKQALKIVELCANEGWLDGRIDCDRCPVRSRCLRFWDDFVVNLDSRPADYLDIIAHKFNRLLAEKHSHPSSLRALRSRRSEPLPPVVPRPFASAQGDILGWDCFASLAMTKGEKLAMTKGGKARNDKE